MKNCALSKKTLLLWQLRFGMVAVILIAAAAFLLFASPWFSLLVAVLVCFFAGLMFFYLPKYFSSYDIRFSQGEIIIRRGVLIETCHIMPFSRLIYAQSFTSPIAKAMRLSGLTLRASRSVLIIPEMDREDALALITAVTEGEIL